jgi:hypothetical protein
MRLRLGRISGAASAPYWRPDRGRSIMGNPPTAEATKAAQRAGIVSIGPRHDRYGFNS